MKLINFFSKATPKPKKLWAIYKPKEGDVSEILRKIEHIKQLIDRRT